MEKNYSKCRVTGKTSFPSLRAAKESMLSFKHRTQVTNPINNKRVKRRIGKPDQCRAYFCPACDGYHITSQKIPINMDKIRKDIKEAQKVRKNYVRSEEETKDWKADSLPFPES